MDEKALLLKFWEKEAPATRKVIARIPEGSTYRPDPKSRTAREIAWLIVREEISRRRTRERRTGMGGDPGACDRQRDSRRLRPTSRKSSQETAGHRSGTLGAESAVHVPGPASHERKRLRERMGVPARYHSSSRTAFHLPASDGFNGAANLRAQRRRDVERCSVWNIRRSHASFLHV